MFFQHLLAERSIVHLQDRVARSNPYIEHWPHYLRWENEYGTASQNASDSDLEWKHIEKLDS
jgi:hypothetical protein